MKRLGSRARQSRPLFAASALLAAALLVGCSTDLATSEDQDIAATGGAADTNAGTAAAGTETAAPAATNSPEATAAAPTAVETSAEGVDPGTTPQPELSETCANTGTELINTAFGPHTALNRIPVAGDPGTFYSFTISDNQFNPCADLSWIVLDGSLGNADGAGGTGASIGETVVFFHGNQLITDPLPFMMRSVESVQRLDSGGIRILHGHLGGATAEGVTETFPTTHTWTGTALDSDLSALPAPMPDNLTRIDVAAPPMTPATESAEVSQTLAAGRYRLPINDNQSLLCDIGHADGPTADCYADFPTTWKMVSNQRPQATRVIFTVDPPHARGTADPTPTASRAQEYGQVQGDTTLLIGEAVVDLTQPNQTTISTAGSGLLITPDSYEVIGGQPN